MKKTLSIIILLLIVISTFSQEDPFYKQYLFNNSLINSAIASRDNFLSIKLTDRHQWIGINDSPQMQTLSINNKFKNKMGVGGNIYHEKYGPIQNTGLQLSYFYDLPLKASKIGSQLSFGISGSIFYKSLNESDLHTLEPNDFAITGASESTFFPNASASVFYYNRIFSVGLSASNLIPSSEKIFNSDLEPKKSRTYILYSDATFSNEINTFAYVPSIVFRINENMDREININSKVYFNNFLWLGLSYRDALEKDIYKNHSVAALLGLRIFNMFFIGYSYEVGLNYLQSYNSGSHEFMLGGNIYKKKQNIPRYF